MKTIFSDTDKKYMIDHYLNNTYRDIAKHLGFTEKQIKSWLNGNGYTKNRKINDWYFNEINKPLKAYFLGYLFADGWVVNNTKTFNYEVGMQLQSKDKYILEKLNDELGGKNIIYHNDSYTHSIKGIKTTSKESDYIRIYSKKLVLGLISNGVVENKTQKDICPKISDEFFFDWLRGYIDGDGCFWKYKNNYYLQITCASEKVLEYVQQRLKTFDIITHLYKEYDKKYRLICTDINEMVKLVKNLYYEDDLFCLKRKYEKVKYYLGFAV